MEKWKKELKNQRKDSWEQGSKLREEAKGAIGWVSTSYSWKGRTDKRSWKENETLGRIKRKKSWIRTNTARRVKETSWKAWKGKERSS